MSRHHPYSGYDEGSHHHGGHRKHSRGGGRGSYGAHARGTSRRGSVSARGGAPRTGWESLGFDRSFEDGPSRISEREMPNGPRHIHKGPKARGMKAKMKGDHQHNPDSAEKELSIDARIQRERPCRTLFVRNVKYETNSREVRERFEQMGEIKIFFDLIGTRGMVFITYYDIRAATMAKEKLQASDVCGRPIDVHYSLPKDNELERRCDRDKNQATLFLAITGANRPIEDDELMAKLSVYGEVRSIKHFKDSPYQRFIEYWDSRACERAHDDLAGSSYLGGKLDLKFSWDTGMVPKARLSMQLDNPSAPYGHYFDNQWMSGLGFGGDGLGNNAEKAGYESQDHLSRFDSHHLQPGADYAQPGADYGDRGRRREPNLHDRNNSYGSSQNGHHDSYQQSGQGYLADQSQPPPLMPNHFGSGIDERRLNQAHKVQELLASLTKAGTLPSVGGSPSLGAGHSPAPSFGSLGTTYAPDMAQSHSAPHALYGAPAIQPGPPASAFGSVYPPYPELAGIQGGSGAPGNFANLAAIMGQLSYLPSVPAGQADGGAAYLPTFDRQSPGLGTAGASGPTLPASVLALLQQSQYGTSVTAVQRQQHTYQPLKGETSVGVASAIPTAPRAMQSTNPNFIMPNGAAGGSANEASSQTGAEAKQAGVGGAQSGNGAHQYQHQHQDAQPVGGGGGIVGPAGLPSGATTGAVGNPASGTASSQAAAVHHLLQALLQQQHQQKKR